MRRALTIFVAILLAQATFAQTRAEILRARLLDPNGSDVLVAAHRADWRSAPENSLEAIESAIRMGVEIVEIDVRRTLGGTLILHHDPILFRPKNAPTLEEALLATKDRVLVNLDKAFPYFDEVMEIAERTGTVEQIIMKSSRLAADVEKRLGKYKGRVIFMPIINLNSTGAISKVEAYVQRMDPPMFELTFRDDASPVLTIVRARLEGRSRLWYDSLWPALCGGHDDAASLEDHSQGFGWLIDKAGAGAIQTDIPAVMIEYLKTR
ncbi:MAG: glycerophosphodiester phosphodiesterase family protein [Bacteroidales bacterium]|nr:glycerophosphodiester phosphodiesterase family protein [Bacteroidales bacterium]